MAKSTPQLGPRRGTPVWYGYGHSLTEKARRQLAECLGLDEQDKTHAERLRKVFIAAQYWLGFYPGGVQALDNAPRAADYMRASESLFELSRVLLNELASLNKFIRDDLDSRKDEPEHRGLTALENSLLELMDACIATKNRNKDERSSGRPKGIALYMVISNLRTLFRENYQGPPARQQRRGAVVYRSDQNARELRFVEIALKDAKIRCRNLAQLFRDPRCAGSERSRP